MFDALGSGAHGPFWVFFGPCTWAVPIPDLFLVTQVGVEVAFEAGYVELEFFMFSDLVV
jgi:hypothetical protein